MIKALIVRIFEKKKREKKRERNKENKKGKKRKENKTNRPYVIELCINLISIDRMYNVTFIYYDYMNINVAIMRICKRIELE